MNNGILGTRATWAADLNLIMQVVFLGVLVAGLVQAKKRNLKVHHSWMSVMVLINAVLVIAIMNPAFFRALPSAVQNPVSLGAILPLPHVLVGGVAELLGLYAVLSTRMDLPQSLRPRNLKWLMRITFALWALALVGGIVLYWLWYV